MAHCPSHDWDRYCALMDPPEQCPVCGADNADAEGEPVYAGDPAYCSQACAEIAEAWAQAEAEAEAEEYERLRREGGQY